MKDFLHSSSAPIPVVKKQYSECSPCYDAYRAVVDATCPKITDDVLRSLKDEINNPMFEFEDFDTLETPILKDFRQRNIVEDNQYITFILHLTELNHSLLKKLEALQRDVDNLHKKFDERFSSLNE